MSEHKLKIKTLTWNRESSGLFDYENRNYSSSTFKLSEDSFILRSSEKVYAQSTSAELPQAEDCKILATFTRSASNFLFHPVLTPQSVPFEKPWLPVRCLAESEYLLSEGDTLRLGKVKLKVKELKSNRSLERKKLEIHSKKVNTGGLGKSLIKNDKLVNVRKIDEENLCCKVCLTEEVDPDDQLISPCYCAGTMGPIHIKCLQKWLESKITSTFNNTVKVYKWKSLECELCKFKYPRKIAVDDKIIDLVCIEKPDCSYLVLESKSEGLKNYSVLSFGEKESYRLGRGYDSDMRIPDISVSRNHAAIICKPAGFFIKDLGSKFGTLVRVKRQIILDLNSKIELQCGRTIVKVSVKKPFSIFTCFLGCSKGKDSDEEMQKYARDLTEESFPNQM